MTLGSEVPAHDRRDRRTLAVIINDGTGTLSSGNYQATFSRRGQGYPSFVQLAKRTHHVWRTGEVKDFPRQRLLAWDLLHRALTSALGSRAVVER